MIDKILNVVGVVWLLMILVSFGLIFYDVNSEYSERMHHIITNFGFSDIFVGMIVYLLSVAAKIERNSKS